jgi:hypothetical protein
MCWRNGFLVIAGMLLFVGAVDAQVRVLPPVQVPATGAEDGVPATAADIAGAKTLEAITDRSVSGLTFEHRGDGTISVDLQGRFMHVLMASPGPDGRLEVACHTGRAAGSPDFVIHPWRPVRGSQATGRLDTAALRAPLKVTVSKTPVLEVK